MNGIIFVTFSISITWICTSLFQINLVCSVKAIVTEITNNLFSAYAKYKLFVVTKHHDNQCYRSYHIHILFLWKYGDH